MGNNKESFLERHAESDWPVFLEKLGTAIGDAKNATTCIFKKIGHLHVGASPCNPVVENALLTTWKELFLLILSKSEFFGQKIDSLTIGVFFPIGTEFQEGSMMR